MESAPALTQYFQQASSDNASGWLWLAVLSVGILIVWALLIYQASQVSSHENNHLENPPSAAARETADTHQMLAHRAGEADDLTIIEGIGPKIAELLKNEGIDTFSKLAGMDTRVLEEILARANLRFASPATWSRQAKLVVEGDWEGLEEFQDRLKGGRQPE
jgi:predicted flap endonuclease-1-like 5' DNA nuclease